MTTTYSVTSVFSVARSFRTYFPKTTIYTKIGAAMRTIMAKSWDEGQPARQVLPELQKELERIMQEAKR